MNPYITLVFTIASNVVGQILIKKGMLNAGKVPENSKAILIFLLKVMFQSPYILIGLILAVLSMLSWMATVSKLPLGFAYSFISLGFPLVQVCSIIFFGETVSLVRWAGLAVLVFGMYLIGKG